MIYHNKFNYHILLQLSLEFYFFSLFNFLTFKTYLIASSNTLFTPYRVKALHSKYLHLNFYSKILDAIYFCIGAFFTSLTLERYYYLKSILFPIKILIDEEEYYSSSGNH